MAVTFASGAAATLNLGRDGANIVLTGPFGTVPLVNVTEFEAKQDTNQIKSDQLNGKRLRFEEPAGWSGSFSVDRGTNDLDNEFSKIETSWIANGNAPLYTMTQFVTEANGSTSRYMYTNVTLKLDDSGMYRTASTVKQKVSFQAYQRIVS